MAIRESPTRIKTEMAAQDERRSEFTGALEGHHRTLAKRVENSSNEIDERLTKVESEAAEALARIHFQDDANKEPKQADRWRLAAVIALLLVAAGTRT